MGNPFEYKHLGSMASVGRYKALVDLRQSKVNEPKLLGIKHHSCFLRSLHVLICIIWGELDIGCERHINGRVRQLVHMAICLSHSCNQLEKQVLCGCELGYHSCLWQRQLSDWLRLKPTQTNQITNTNTNTEFSPYPFFEYSQKF